GGDQHGYWVEEIPVANVSSGIPTKLETVKLVYEQSSGMKLDDPRLLVSSQKGALWSHDTRVMGGFVGYEAAREAKNGSCDGLMSLDVDLGRG
ncbi:MAG: hypothetical protein Q9174_004571, partial [Haloplaca sp. 1 TL-2023]